MMGRRHILGWGLATAFSGLLRNLAPVCMILILDRSMKSFRPLNGLKKMIASIVLDTTKEL
jgi:hypothetical protein